MKVAKIETRDYYNCARAAAALGLTADSIRVYCNNHRVGKTPAIVGMQIGDKGGQWLIHKREIARYKKERRDPGKPRQVG